MRWCYPAQLRIKTSLDSGSTPANARVLLQWYITLYDKFSPMLYILLTLLSGIASGIVSIYFRTIELKKKIILMPKQLVTQIALFVLFALVFWEFFTTVSINLWFIDLWWFIIYLLFSSASYYAVQVFYEFYTGNTLFATEEEMRKYLEKIESER